MLPMQVFEGKALARAPQGAGHDVSERTVQRWTAGQAQPRPQDVEAIRRVLGVAEAGGDRPAWAAELATRTDVADVVRQAQREVTEELRTNREVVSRASKLLESLGGLGSLLADYRSALEHTLQQLDDEDQASPARSAPETRPGQGPQAGR